MKTIEIKGKQYVPVVERVKEFHRLFPGGWITTEIIPDADKAVVRATVNLGQIGMESKRVDGVITHFGRVFTGHSQAVFGEGRMGDVALEVAETSAIGRALGFANIGLLDGIASADEMRKVKKVKVGDLPEDDDLGF